MEKEVVTRQTSCFQPLILNVVLSALVVQFHAIIDSYAKDTEWEVFVVDCIVSAYCEIGIEEFCVHSQKLVSDLWKFVGYGEFI